VDPIAGDLDAFLVARVVNDDDAPLELDGTAAHLFVQQIVVVGDKGLRTDSYCSSISADGGTVRLTA
jgi:hypothetical protein